VFRGDIRDVQNELCTSSTYIHRDKQMPSKLYARVSGQNQHHKLKFNYLSWRSKHACDQWYNNRPCRPCNAGERARVGGPCASPNIFFHDMYRLCIVVLNCTGNASLRLQLYLSVKLWLVIRCHVLGRMTRHLGKWRKPLLRYWVVNSSKWSCWQKNRQTDRQTVD